MGKAKTLADGNITSASDEHQIIILADDSQLKAALSELNSYFLGNAIEQLVSLSQLGSEIISIDLCDSTATPTGELRVLLKPSDFFLHFIATLATGNR